MEFELIVNSEYAIFLLDELDPSGPIFQYPHELECGPYPAYHRPGMGKKPYVETTA